MLTPNRRRFPSVARALGAITGFTALLFVPMRAAATPTTTFWAPSTALCQGFAVPHLTYDTYFRKGPSAGSQGAPNYPIDTGLTVGLIPSGKIQDEVGFDLLLPVRIPST